MSAAHRHDGPPPQVVVGRVPRAVLLTGLALGLVGTVVGVLLLWPGHSFTPAASEQYAAAGVTFPHARVTSVQPACASGDVRGTHCGQVTARVESGVDVNRDITLAVPPELLRAGLSPGTTLVVMRVPTQAGQPATWAYFGVDRSTPLLVLTVVFVLLIALVARLRGVLALIGLAFGGAVLIGFMLPALLGGGSGLAVGVIGSAAIMYVVLYVTHGLSLRTSAALAGTLFGIALTAGVGQGAVRLAHLTGVSDETGSLLTSMFGRMSFQGLLTCAIIVAGLGILNDVTITQASAVWELRHAAPHQSRRRIFTGAMRIGRDHIASTIYTMMFAYAGAALPVLLLLYVYQRPLGDVLTTEAIAEEVLRTLASSIGLVLAVPVTTAIAALTLPPALTVSEPETAVIGEAPGPARPPAPSRAARGKRRAVGPAR